jgi:hypothetical protein
MFRRRGFANRAMRFMAVCCEFNDARWDATKRCRPRFRRALRNGLADAPRQIHEPHSGHTHRDTLRPLSAVRSIARGSSVRWKACTSINIARENPLLVKR